MLTKKTSKSEHRLKNKLTGFVKINEVFLISDYQLLKLEHLNNNFEKSYRMFSRFLQNSQVNIKFWGNFEH